MVVVSQPLSVDRCAHTIHMIGRPWNHSKGGPWNPPPWFEQRYAQTKVCKVRVRRSPADEAVVRSACGRARRRHRRRCPRITDIRLPRRPRRHATHPSPPPSPGTWSECASPRRAHRTQATETRGRPRPLQMALDAALGGRLPPLPPPLPRALQHGRDAAPSQPPLPPRVPEATPARAQRGAGAPRDGVGQCPR